jgi:hypothetical protein
MLEALREVGLKGWAYQLSPTIHINSGIPKLKPL